jgi:hypothetical protein
LGGFGVVEKHYPIKGVMVKSTLEINNANAMNLSKDDVKTKIATDLVLTMLNNDLIEFTQQKDAVSNSIVIRARSFVVNSADVQLLRVIKQE